MSTHRGGERGICVHRLSLSPARRQLDATVGKYGASVELVEVVGTALVLVSLQRLLPRLHPRHTLNSGQRESVRT